MILILSILYTVLVSDFQPQRYCISMDTLLQTCALDSVMGLFNCTNLTVIEALAHCSESILFKRMSTMNAAMLLVVGHFVLSARQVHTLPSCGLLGPYGLSNANRVFPWTTRSWGLQMSVTTLSLMGQHGERE